MLKLRLADALAAVPLLAWLLLVVVGSVAQIVGRTEPDLKLFLNAVDVTNVALALALMILLLVRRPALRKAPGVAPRLAGVVGFAMPIAVAFFLPRVELSPINQLVSSAVILCGTLASIGVLVWLGRCFSILPQARGIVTSGPYAYVRHPLYLAEMVTIFGLMWSFAFPWSLLALLLSVAVQFPRMYFEEQVLGEAFPAYKDYARGKARLFPGLL